MRTSGLLTITSTVQSIHEQSDKRSGQSDKRGGQSDKRGALRRHALSDIFLSKLVL